MKETVLEFGLKSALFLKSQGWQVRLKPTMN